MIKQFKGLGVSQGRALGYIHIFEENNYLIDNRPVILVVKSLSRQIVTSLANNVVGVIAETGSIGSHGSGILRELGIPCVLRIDNAKNIFKEGQIVEIDGNSSKIVIMKEFDGDSQKNKNIVPIHISREKKCYRPERLYQKLRFDILKRGWEESPHFLFGIDKCELVLDKGIVYIKNGPILSEICDYVINNCDWYIGKAKERMLEIDEIKYALKELQSSSEENIVDICINLEKSILLYDKLVKYIYLSQFIADELIDRLIAILYEVNPDIKEEYVNTLRSNYVMNSLEQKNDPGISTTWVIPAREPHIWDGVIDWERKLGDIETLKKIYSLSEHWGYSYFTEYCALNIIVPIVYQISEEHYFISSSICSFLNKYLDIISIELMRMGIIQKQVDIFDMSWEEVSTYINKFKKGDIRV